jgi:hypothetical protein
MALTEQRILKSVEIKLDSSTIDVAWADQILRDGEVIQETVHRRAYNSSEKTLFETDVANGTLYTQALGW